MKTRHRLMIGAMSAIVALVQGASSMSFAQDLVLMRRDDGGVVARGTGEDDEELLIRKRQENAVSGWEFRYRTPAAQVTLTTRRGPTWGTAQLADAQTDLRIRVGWITQEAGRVEDLAEASSRVTVRVGAQRFDFEAGWGSGGPLESHPEFERAREELEGTTLGSSGRAGFERFARRVAERLPSEPWHGYLMETLRLLQPAARPGVGGEGLSASSLGCVQTEPESCAEICTHCGLVCPGGLTRGCCLTEIRLKAPCP